MTKDGVNKWWNELVALKNGETIETRVKYGLESKWSDWKSDSSPEFSSTPDREHRIKPKPRECWLVKMNEGSMESFGVFKTLEVAEACRKRNLDCGFGELEIIHMVEAV
jgi:hypothetical protein